MTERHQHDQLTVVVAACNEAESLPLLHPRIRAALDGLEGLRTRVLYVDDGSHDGTWEVLCRIAAQDPEVSLLRLSRNFGKEAALTAGLAAARGEVVVLMDADGQHPPALLADMLRHWQGGADVVYAVRSTRADQSALHRRLVAAFYGIVNWRSRVRIPRDAGDFRLLDRRVVDALLALPERHRFMKGLYAWVGFPSVALDYEPLPRHAGESRYGLSGALGLGTTGLLAFTAALRSTGITSSPPSASGREMRMRARSGKARGLAKGGI